MVHGTKSGYTGGCRCDACTKANRLYHRAYGHRRKGGYWATVANLEFERLKRIEDEARKSDEERKMDEFAKAHPTDYGAWRRRARLEAGLD